MTSKEMTVREHLIAAKALIDTPEKWAQGELARDANNDPVSMFSEKAVCFCAMGAVYKVPVGWKNTAEILKKLDAAAAEKANQAWNIASFNDKATHAEVMQVFDRAIELS